jgi:hypothetical protein
MSEYLWENKCIYEVDIDQGRSLQQYGEGRCPKKLENEEHQCVDKYEKIGMESAYKIDIIVHINSTLEANQPS